MFAAEFAPDFDVGQMRAQVITLGGRPSELEIQLCTLPVADANPAQLHGGRIVGFRETGC